MVSPAKSPAAAYDTVLILDFGSQYTHLITRRVRELGAYSEVLCCTAPPTELAFTPKAVILSGGPHSVYDACAPHVHPAYLALGVPVLGVCYGLQELVNSFAPGAIAACSKREYGDAQVDVVDDACILRGCAPSMPVWMSHGDQVTRLPGDGWRCIARTSTAPFAAVACAEKRVWGVQFHPEVTHSALGKTILANFLDIAGVKRNWTMDSYIEQEITTLRTRIGPDAHVIGAVSGGVDSTVAAKLLHEAIGPRFHAILVDNGLMRLDECKKVHANLTKNLGINLTVVDAGKTFLDRLAGVTDPEKKRKIIGNTFVNVFDAEAERIEAATGGKVEFLLQGTLYPDVIESLSWKGPSQTIKTHHNVGGLLPNMKLKLIEPLRELFKDEVRALGRIMKIPDSLLMRHPFPGPGLGIRVLGEVTPAQVKTLQHADDIFISELVAHGVYGQISQAYAALLPVKTVGVMGDKRTYEQVVALRAVKTDDFMTADVYEFEWAFLKRVSKRIVNEVAGVNRVVYDTSTKPPATIEWE